ncbi:unnamed protein product, partial [Mesorhabditis spiculigera]
MSDHPRKGQRPERVEGEPRWTVTRREHSETIPLSPAIPNDDDDTTAGPFHSRTMTTTERVQILQMPVPISDSETAPALLLALSSPNGNTTQSISSTVTSLPATGTPLIGGLTASGLPLFNGIHVNRDSRHTTTVITTTTTTYRVIEVTDSESMSSSGEFERDFEFLDHHGQLLADEGELTVNIPLHSVRTPERLQNPSPATYMIVGKTESTPTTPNHQSVHMGFDIAPVEQPVVAAGEDEYEMVEYTISPAGSTCGEDQIASTSRQMEIQDAPIRNYVDVYHVGTSDKVEIDTMVEYEVVYDEEETVIPDKANARGDFELTEEYDGPIDSTHRHTDVEGLPLASHVQVYHHGRSDVGEPSHVVVEEKSEVAEKPTLADKFTGLFRKGPSHLDYPISEAFEGPIDSTHRHTDVEGLPLASHVQVYHHGRSDVGEPSHVVVEEKSEVHDKPTLADKFTGLFRKGPSHLDYPISEAFEGPIDSTHRHTDVEGLPLASHVQVYHHGRSDVGEPSHVVVEEKPEVADKPTLADKFTGLFRKGPSHLDYPISEAFEGPIDSTHRHTDVEGLPLASHVQVYHHGRSDVGEPSHVVVEEKSEVHDKPTLADKFTGLFRKGPSHLDYPISEAFEGPIDSTHRHTDVEGLPLASHVQVYHHGRSDVGEPSHVVVEEKSEVHDKPTLADKFTGLFRKGPSHLDYPISEAFEGPIDSTHRHTDVEGLPLASHVQVYHHGRSDVGEPSHVVVEEKSEVHDKPTLADKFTGLFRKGPSHLDYPISEAFEGPIDSTHRHTDVEGLPLASHVQVYHHGRSDVGEPSHVVVEEKPEVAEKPTLADKFTGLFRKGPSHLDYPISEAFEGPIDSTHRHTDVEGLPLASHVQVYHHGRSDVGEPSHVVVEEKSEVHDKPTLADKFTGLFRKGPSHLDYPISEAFEGPIDSTHRHTDVEGLPLASHVQVYHHGRSDVPEPSHVVVEEKSEVHDKPTLADKFTGLFRKGPSHLDYPISEAFEGPIDSTHRHTDVEGLPLASHVQVYHHGRSDVPEPSHVVVEEKSEVHDKPTLADKFTGLFRKGPSHLDYPINEAFEGPIDSTHRHTDVEGLPLASHVQVYHHGRSDVPEPSHVVVEEKSEVHDKPTLADKFTGLFRKGPSHLDYPISEAFEGPIDSTHRHTDVEGLPLASHVQVYHHGRSDVGEPSHVVVEEKSEVHDKPTLADKFTGLFRKGPSHLDYPISEAFEGPIDSTHRHTDVEGLPLASHVQVYHHGRSDVGEPSHVVVEEKSEVAREADTGRQVHCEAFEGLIDSTHRHTDVEGLPLASHVQVYHHGRSDVGEPSHVVVEEKSEVHDKPTLADKFTGLFRKGPSHLDYPFSEAFEGPIDSTHRHTDVEGLPLASHVQVYHHGRSDVPEPSHVVVEEKSEVHDKPTLADKFTGLFRKGPSHLDYPFSEAFEGPIDSTHRHTDVEGLPLASHVQVYHHGRSDVGEPSHVVVEEKSEVHDKPTLADKFTGLFRKGPSHLDYPISEAFEGPIDSTHRHTDVEGLPLASHVQVYHHGRSDVGEPSHVVVEEKSEVHDKPTLADKFTGLFRKGPSHLDYPISEAFEGPIDSTHRHTDVEGLPLASHVQVYHHGRSDVGEPSHVVVEEKSEVHDKPTLADKFTGLFRKGPSHLDYPISEAFEGPIDSTHRHTDVEGLPLASHVQVYHHGRSDVPEPSHVVVEEKSEVHDKPTLADKFTGLFRKGPSHLDYPISEAFEGPIDSTHRHTDVEGLPLASHVQVYHHGRSDVGEPSHVVVEEKSEVAEKPTLADKFTGLFRKGPSHLDYPISEAFEGPIDSTHRHTDVEGLPLASHVQVYHHGRSDVGEPSHVVVEEKSEVAEKPTLADKFTGLFRKGPSHLDYPISEAFEGPIDSTHRHTDVEGLPLASHVQVYHHGRSDVGEPSHVVVEEKSEVARQADTGRQVHCEAFEGPIDSTHRHTDVEGLPLASHVQVYHHGRSDVGEPSHVVVEEKSEVHDKPTLADKFTGLFRKGPSHLDYPISEAFEGPIDSTHRHTDVEGLPLASHVQVYHHGRSDVPEPSHVVVEEKSEVHDKPTLADKFTGLFRKGPSHLDYPISEAFEGPIDSTHRHTDVEGLPLASHVQVYHHGRSDVGEPSHVVVEEKSEVHDKPTLADKFTGLFRKGPSHLDYPISEAFEGPIDSTHRHTDVEGLPLASHVQVYHHGRSDVPEPSHVVVEEKSEVHDKPTLADKFTGLFRKGPSHLDYPISEAFEGPIDSTHRHTDVEGLPLASHVQVYHHGRSDVGEPSHVVVEEKSEVHDKPTLADKFTGLFRKGPSHLDYPISEAFEGPIDSTHRHTDVEGLPLASHVQVYHHGRSDVGEPSHVVVEEKSEVHDKPTLADKFTGLFRKGPSHLDYPISEAFEGPIDSTHRHTDVEGLPLASHVQVYHHGRSDVPEPSHVVVEEKSEVHDKPTLADKFTGLFRKGPSHLDYPISEAFEGPIDSTHRHTDVEGLPLASHVQVYHHGRSDVGEPSHVVVEEKSEVHDKPTLADKFTGLFRKGPSHLDYPISEAFEGPIDSTHRHTDVEGLPLASHVQVYHHGRSDVGEPSHVVVEEKSEVARQADTGRQDQSTPPIVTPMWKDYRWLLTSRSTTMAARMLESHRMSSSKRNRKSHDKPTLADKFTGLFRKGPSHLDYPISEAFEGPIDSTHRHTDVEGLPLASHVQVYHHGRSDVPEPSHVVVEEKSEVHDKPTLADKFTGLFRKGPSHLDYPISEAFEGPIDSTHRHTDVEGLPLASHVQVYHHGRSDVGEPSHVVVEEKSEVHDKPTLADKFTGLFRKGPSHLDYPISEAFEGPIDSTHRHTDVEGLPLASHVQVYHHGRSDVGEPSHVVVEEKSEVHDKPTLADKFTGLFRKGPSHLDYPISEAFEGPIDSTHRHTDVEGLPLASHVQVYHHGRSDVGEPSHVVVEEKSEVHDKPTLADKFTGLFRKGPSHLDYPISEAFEGPIDSTHRHTDVEGLPLASHVQVYHHGRSDVGEPSHVVVEEKSEVHDKPTLADKFTGLFRKGPSHLDYPISEAFEGPIDSTHRHTDVEGLPLASHVQVYHHGRSDVGEPSHVVVEEKSEVHDKPTLADKFTGLFRKGPSHLDYPISEAFEGPIDSTHRHTDVEGLPLASHVQVYHHGRSDVGEPSHVVVEEKSEVHDKPTLADKFTGLFRKGPSHLDYPISEAFEGPIDSTHRHTDVEGLPLASHVQVYHHGRSDVPEPSHVVVEEKSEVHDKPTLADKFTGLFRKGPSHLDYPISEAFEGPIDSTHRHTDVEGLPLASHVQVYHHGRSDVGEPSHVVVEEKSEVAEKPTLADKFTGLFRKGPSHLDYPISEAFEGPIDSTHRHTDVEGLPLASHVQVYHHGRSDVGEPSHVVVEEKSEVHDKPTLADKFTGLFRKGPSHLDYPISEAFEGPIDSTHRHTDVEGLPLASHVQVYHHGRSDVGEPSHVVVEEKSEVHDKPTLADKFTGLFRKGPSHLDYPISEAFEGPIDSTHRHTDVEGLPLASHVQVYHHGRSDVGEPSHVVVEEKSEVHDKPTLADKFTGLFRKGPSHLDYPISEAFEGPIDSTHRHTDVEGLPLASHVQVYHHGRSDVGEPSHVVVEEKSEVHDKPTLADKFTGLFRKGPSHLDYPISEAFEGPIDSTHRHTDVEGLPLASHVQVYHHGRSDVGEPSHVVVEEKSEVAREADTGRQVHCEAFEGPIDSTHRHTDVEGLPLASHVQVYHHGRSDVGEPSHVVVEEKSEVHDKPTLADKFTGLFRKGPSHLDYPISEAFEGPIDSTHRHTDVYHHGRSDVGEPSHVVVEEKSEVHDKPTLADKFTGLFRKGPSHLDYPISEAFEGPIDSTHRHTDVEGLPLASHVQVYHHGRSDVGEPSHVVVEEKSEVHDKPTLADKFTGLFRKGPSHLDYPISEAFEGPIDSTHRHTDVEGLPLASHVQVYHHGRSDVGEPSHVVVEEKSEVHDKPTLADKFTGLFRKGPSHLDYPISEAFEGPIDSTHRHTDVEGLPLASHVQVYHHGRSDVGEPSHVVVEEKSEVHDKPTLADKFTGLFRKGPSHLDYPISEAFEGPIDSTHRHTDVEGLPLASHVQVYHHGRSDVGEPSHVVVEEKSEVHEKPTLADKFTGLFRKGPSHLDYPISEAFEGPIDSTHRHTDVEGLPLASHVQVYHHGRSDVGKPSHVVVEEKSEVHDKPTLAEKFTGLFRKGPSHLDYPISEAFEGPIDSTHRHTDVEGLPLASHVQVYHHGRSDVGEPSHVVVEEKSEVHDKPTLADKFTGLFRKGPSHLDYPISEAFEGPIDSTHRHTDVEGLPLASHVQVYHHGRSDVAEPSHVVVEEKSEVHDKPTLADKFTGLFRKGPSHLDYPISEAFEGPIDSTHRHTDVEGLPLASHVQVYHHGRSDVGEPSHVVVEEKSEVHDKPTLADKFTGLFRKGPSHLDYPISEAFEGPIDSTHRHTDVEGLPLASHVQVYHHGRSDVGEPSHVVVEEKSEVHDKPTLADKFTGLFRKGPSHLDYPISEAFEGPIDSTHRHTDVEGLPLASHVQVYHHGRSDVGEPSHVVVEEKSEVHDKPTLADKFTGLFRKGPSHLDYPISEAFEGPIDSTHRHTDVEGLPLASHVQVYHHGRSDVGEPSHVVVEEKSEVAEKPTLADKFTGLFRKGPSHLDYPISEAFEGPIDSTHRHTDVEGLPLASHVQVYHHGRSDVGEPSHVVVEEKSEVARQADTGRQVHCEAFEGPIDSTHRHTDVEGLPLASHVQVYHHGRSDVGEPSHVVVEEKSEVAEKPTLADKFTGLFRKGPSHLDYPISEAFEGPIDSTHRHTDVEGL